MAIEDKREASRVRTHWRIAIIFDEAENKPAIHGHTHELSFSGASVHTDRNVASTAPVTVLLSPPLAYEGNRQKTIEIRANLVYSVYSGSNFCFRIGLDFINFKNDGLQILRDRLEPTSSLLD